MPLLLPAPPPSPLQAPSPSLLQVLRPPPPPSCPLPPSALFPFPPSLTPHPLLNLTVKISSPVNFLIYLLHVNLNAAIPAPPFLVNWVLATTRILFKPHFHPPPLLAPLLKLLLALPIFPRLLQLLPSLLLLLISPSPHGPQTPSAVFTSLLTPSMIRTAQLSTPNPVPTTLWHYFNYLLFLQLLQTFPLLCKPLCNPCTLCSGEKKKNHPSSATFLYYRKKSSSVVQSIHYLTQKSQRYPPTHAIVISFAKVHRRQYYHLARQDCNSGSFYPFSHHGLFSFQNVSMPLLFLL